MKIRYKTRTLKWITYEYAAELRTHLHKIKDSDTSMDVAKWSPAIVCKMTIVVGSSKP